MLPVLRMHRIAAAHVHLAGGQPLVGEHLRHAADPHPADAAPEAVVGPGDHVIGAIPERLAGFREEVRLLGVFELLELREGLQRRRIGLAAGACEVHRHEGACRAREARARLHDEVREHARDRVDHDPAQAPAGAVAALHLRADRELGRVGSLSRHRTGSVPPRREARFGPPRPPASTSRASKNSAPSMLTCGTTRSSHFGIHQLTLPIRTISAGTSRQRTTVASRIDGDGQADPELLDRRDRR